MDKKVNSTKEEFIRAMMQRVTDNKTNKHTRDRILTLIAKEIGKPNLTREDVVAIVEERMGKGQKEDKGNTEGGEVKRIIDSNLSETKPQNSLPKYFPPYHLYQFLFNFNQNPILKYTCHNIDSDALKAICEACGTEEYDFLKHRELIKIECDKILKLYASTYIKSLIRIYVLGQNFYGKKIGERMPNRKDVKGWGNDIKMNWFHQDLEKWAVENPGVPPNPDVGLSENIGKFGFSFKPFRTLYSGKIDQFSKLVLHFKHLFHIRNDNSLKSILEKVNEVDFNNRINFTYKYFTERLEFFTDVDKLTSAYKMTLEAILENNVDRNVEIELGLVEKSNSIELSILHRGGVFNKSISNISERSGDKLTRIIRNINGVCNFYLEADFDDNAYFVNLWDSKDKEYKEISKVGGVKHVFEILKNKTV